jgi:hypothetical protein
VTPRFLPILLPRESGRKAPSGLYLNAPMTADRMPSGPDLCADLLLRRLLLCAARAVPMQVIVRAGGP